MQYQASPDGFGKKYNIPDCKLAVHLAVQTRSVFWEMYSVVKKKSVLFICSCEAQNMSVPLIVFLLLPM